MGGLSRANLILTTKSRAMTSRDFMGLPLRLAGLLIFFGCSLHLAFLPSAALLVTAKLIICLYRLSWPGSSWLNGKSVSSLQFFSIPVISQNDDTNTIVLFLVPLKLEGLRALHVHTGLLIFASFSSIFQRGNTLV